MRALIAIAFACCVGIASAASEPPIDKRQSASGAYGLRHNDDRGTRENPLVIESRSAEPSDAKAKQEEAEKAEHANAESVIATATAWLAGITALLAVATIVLGYFTFRLWDETKNLRVGADAQGKENARVATRQLGLSGRQLRLLDSQTALMEKQYLATHRPQLVVRRISVDTIEGIGVRDTAKIQFVIANVGDTPAIDVMVAARVWFTELLGPLPAIPEYPDLAPFVDKMESGQALPAPIHEERQDVCARLVHVLRVGLTRAPGVVEVPLAMGLICYKDAKGDERRTAFLRKYDFASGRFSPIGDDPDYEYQD